MKRIVGACAAIGVLQALSALPAVAQQPPGVNTREFCWRAVTHEARGKFSARVVDEVSSRVSPMSAVENRLEGTGVADGRPFSFTCTFNYRTAQTYAVSVRREGRPVPPPPAPLPLPAGSWAASCVSPEMRGPVLFAQCRMIGGGWSGARLDMRACRSGRAANRDGMLVCG